jgi:cobalt-zinc-cadmium resistance protein CzcA
MDGLNLYSYCGNMILLLLFWTFNLIRLALLVLCNLPFALVGGLFTSSLATLLILPAMYGWVEREETAMRV